MKPFTPPSVSIDGHAIRRIREEGRLTQLYVAKVVGVTTDTVSRWENNRYPTMRRDNALKLAEALEVDLQQILQQEETEPEQISPAAVPVVTKPLRRTLSLVLLLTVTASAFIYFLQEAPVKEVLLRGHRHVPHYTSPGTRVPIRLDIVSEKKLKGMIVREEFPPDWTLVEADPPPASIDNLKGSVRWMVRNPQQSNQIVYVLQAPENSPVGSQIILDGEIVANPDGQRFSVKLLSDAPLKIEPLHWADTNGNSKIDDLEILEISDMVDDSENIHYDWDLIEKLWDAGSYTFDAITHKYIPQETAPKGAK